jgi:outer membrane protein assembly factor BamB
VNQRLLTLAVAALAASTLFVAPGCGPLNKDKNAAGKSNIGPIPANSFAQTWSNGLRLGGDAADELHLRGDQLFVYTRKDVVYCLGSQGGELRYGSDVQTSGGTLRPPTVIGNRVVYPSGSTIEVYNDAGRPVRSVELEKGTRSGLVYDPKFPNIVYIGLDHPGGLGTLARVDLNRNYKVIDWEMLTYGAVTPTPALFDQVIYAGAEDGRLYAVNSERQPVWALPPPSGSTAQSVNWFQTRGAFVSDIKADETGVYAANTDSRLYCLDRQTGKIRWSFYAGAPLRTAPVVMPQNVYQYVERTGVVCLDKLNGKFVREPKWVVRDAVQFLSEDQANAYLKRKDNRIVAVDKNTGEPRFVSKQKFDLIATNTQTPLIYAANRDGRVFAIRPVLQEGEVGTVVLADE